VSPGDHLAFRFTTVLVRLDARWQLYWARAERCAHNGTVPVCDGCCLLLLAP
jgi:hypothetical protein